MKTPLQKVNEFIKRHAMLDGTRGVLVAVSGGPDSVTLLDMLMAGGRSWGLGVGEEKRGGEAEELGSTRLGDGGWGLGVGEEQRSGVAQPPTPIPHPPIPHLHVAHLDHMLRGRGSAKDAEFVRALADRLGLQITISSVDVRAVASSSGRGIEEIAREIRYDFLLEAAREAGCDRIAVGHTMTDQAETFLMRLIRGAGLRGLAAMRAVSEVPVFRQEKAEGRRQKADNEFLPSVLLIRPLLCITREEVESYCRERGLEFRSDATNLDLHYTRNRLRNDVLPALRSINPRVVESVSKAAENIAGDQDVLDGLALSLLRNALLASDVSLPAGRGGGASYSVTSLLEQPVGMRRRMIIEAIRLTRAYLTDKERSAGGEVSSAHVAAVEGLLAPGASGKHIALPGSLEVWREFDAMVLKPKERALVDRLTISSSCPTVEAGGFAFTLERGLPIEALRPVIEGTSHEKNRTGRDWMTVALDDRALPEHLVIRPRRPGQRAHVIGQRQTIKLKNLMIAHRIPSSRRASWPLVTTPDGAYIWSPGLPPALEFAAHNETYSLAMMRALAV